MNEIWRDIPGCTELYQASTHGNIRRKDRLVVNNGTNYVKHGKIISQSKSSKGYMRVRLFFNGKIKEELVHRLIAKTFIPNPCNFPQVNHKDEDKTNNSVVNLEWCDARYNNTYGSRIAKSVIKQSKPVMQFSPDGRVLRSFPSINEAERQTFISAGHICLVCQGKRPTAGGFIWAYKYPQVAYEIFKAIELSNV